MALLPVARVLRLLERPGARERLFGPEECAYALRRPRGGQTLAARLAAKLAARAALLQAGLPRPRLRDLEIVHQTDGAPALRVHGAAARGVERDRFAVSLSHDRELVLASVWLLRRDGRAGTG